MASAKVGLADDLVADLHRQLQAGDDPALHQQDRGFDFCLVAGLVGARGQNGPAAMRRHLGIAAVDFGLTEAGADHPGLEVVRDNQRRHGAEWGESPGVRADPDSAWLQLAPA